MAEGDLFDPVWAEEGEVEVPTSLQIRSGFLCGPVSPGLFNWLFQTLQAAVNAMNLADLASKFRLIATTEGISGGGNLEEDRTLRLDLNGLQKTTTVKDSHVLAVYDPDLNSHRGITRADLVQGLGGGGGGGGVTGATNIGDGTGLVYSGLSSGSLQIRSLKNDGGLAIDTTGNVVTFAIANRAADLTFD